jgi:hypothetical protein
VDRTTTLSRVHEEIARLFRRVGQLLSDIDDTSPEPDEIVDLRRLLCGPHAILCLHTAQEDEGYLSLADDTPPPLAAGGGTPDRVGERRSGVESRADNRRRATRRR